MKKKIKSFVYLDNYKMYSISSQIFEGLTEYVVNYSAKSNHDLEKQEGPIGSGRVLADIISKQISTEEKKFLYDYSYTLFEEKLLEDQRLISIEQSDFNAIDIESLENFSFIKVKGRTLFKDVEIINNTIENFNQIGEALAYVTQFEEIKKQRIQNCKDSEKRRSNNSNGFTNRNTKNDLSASEFAKNSGLYQDEEFLKKLSFVLEYGYKGQFEIQIPLTDEDENKTIFSATLKREYLKESENILIKKYSRYSEKEFVLLGILTQSKKGFSSLDIQEENNLVYTTIKEALVDITLRFSKIEEVFVGKLGNEIIIDPIAVYQEL